MRSRVLLARNEEGVVLVLCLITLVLLTLIGISATTTSQLEAEISGNDKTYKEAFYAAEMALTVGETAVNSLLNRVDLEEGTQPGRYVKGTQPAWDHLVWDNAHSAVVTPVPSGLSKVSDPPRYTIEERDHQRNGTLTIGLPGGQTGTYRFTVRSQGTGSSKAAHVLLESVYAKSYN
jgi:type IV pilus assembly protein PilX